MGKSIYQVYFTKYSLASELIVPRKMFGPLSVSTSFDQFYCYIFAKCWAVLSFIWIGFVLKMNQFEIRASVTFLTELNLKPV